MNVIEYLLMKGIKVKVHQLKKRYSLTIEELIEMLDEYYALQRKTDKEGLLQDRGSDGNNGAVDNDTEKDS